MKVISGDDFAYGAPLISEKVLAPRQRLRSQKERGGRERLDSDEDSDEDLDISDEDYPDEVIEVPSAPAVHSAAEEDVLTTESSLGSEVLAEITKTFAGLGQTDFSFGTDQQRNQKVILRPLITTYMRSTYGN